MVDVKGVVPNLGEIVLAGPPDLLGAAVLVLSAELGTRERWCRVRERRGAGRPGLLP